MFLAPIDQEHLRLLKKKVVSTLSNTERSNLKSYKQDPSFKKSAESSNVFRRRFIQQYSVHSGLNAYSVWAGINARDITHGSQENLIKIFDSAKSMYEAYEKFMGGTLST